MQSEWKARREAVHLLEVQGTGYGVRGTRYGIRGTGYGVRDTGYGPGPKCPEAEAVHLLEAEGEDKKDIMHNHNPHCITL